MLAESGGCETRFAQTVLAETPDSAPLLGHVQRRENTLKNKTRVQTVEWEGKLSDNSILMPAPNIELKNNETSFLECSDSYKNVLIFSYVPR